MKISCSARKGWQYHIRDWLDFFRSHAKIHSNFQYDYEDIDHVFGQVEGTTTLWGGRIADDINLTKVDLYWLYDKNIGLKLPLTNKFITKEQYEESKPFLKRYYRKGNAIITSTDKLAEYIKQDFPDYEIEASCIQDIVDTKKLEKKISLKCYDTIVLPIHMNDDIKFLKSIKNKEKIRLFLNVECSYSCPKKICYGVTSQVNLGKKEKMMCSFYDLGLERKFYKDHINWNDFYFDKSKFEKIGITKYKLVPPWENQQRTALMYKKHRTKIFPNENFKKRIKNLNKEVFFILSTARCRSSWFGNLFTYKDSFCYKEELRYIANWDEFIDRIEKRPEKYVGFADPELLHFIETLYDLFPDAKYALLERDRNDAALSLATVVEKEFQDVDIMKAKFDRWDKDTKKFKKIVKEYTYLHWKNMDDAKAIETVWKYILPNSKFDRDRWQLLASLKVKTTMGGVPFKINHKTCMAPYFNFKKLYLTK